MGGSHDHDQNTPHVGVYSTELTERLRHCAFHRAGVRE